MNPPRSSNALSRWSMIASPNDSASHAALHDVAAEPALHRVDARQEAGGADGQPQGAGNRGPETGHGRALFGAELALAADDREWDGGDVVRLIAQRHTNPKRKRG